MSFELSFKTTVRPAVNVEYGHRHFIIENDRMLILTRRVDERIFIGDDITLCVLDIEGNRVRLGLEAPKDVAILREEVQQRYADKASNDDHHPGPASDKQSA